MKTSAVSRNGKASPKVAFASYDARPVSLRIPKRLAEMGGMTLIAPPARLFGDLTRPCRFEEIRLWAEKAADRADFLIVSADLLAYGGLIQSRAPGVKLKEAMARLRFLKRLKKKRPGLQVWVWSTVLRDAVTAGDQKSFERWKTMQKGVGYPPEHLYCRRRNLRVSKELIEWRRQGALDLLVFCKEDVSSGSPFQWELEELERKMGEAGLEEKDLIQAGADEIGQALLARAGTRWEGKTPRIYLEWIPGNAAGRTARYEHCPLGTAVRRKIRLAGMEKTSNIQNADAQLLVLGFSGKQPDLFLNQIQGVSVSGKKPNGEVAQRLRRMLDWPQPVVFVDVAEANGGDWGLVSELAKRGIYFRLSGYAAWNTAGNALGTGLAAAALSTVHSGDRSDKERDRARRLFLMERALDDAAFQGGYRGTLAGCGVGPWKIKNVKKWNRELARAMEGCLKELKAFSSKAGLKGFGGARVSTARFPWQRLFEAEIEVELK